MSISLKKVLLAGTALVAMNYAASAFAATVVVGNGETVTIETDPDALTAISFTGAEGGDANINDGVDITGKTITAFDGIGDINVDGTTTFSGNIGTAAAALNEIIINSDSDDVATFNGDVFAYDIVINDTGTATFNDNVTVESGDTFTFQADGTANFNGDMMTGDINFNGYYDAEVNFGDGANMTGDIYDDNASGAGTVNFAGNSIIDGGVGFTGSEGFQIGEINVNGAAGTTVQITGNVGAASTTIFIQDTGHLQIDGNQINGSLVFNDDGSFNWNYGAMESYWNGSINSDGGTAGSGFGAVTFTGDNENLNVLDGSFGTSGVLRSFTLAGESNEVWVDDSFTAADTNNLNTNTLNVEGDFFLASGQTIAAAIFDAESEDGIGHVVGDADDEGEGTEVESGAIVQVTIDADNSEELDEGDEFTIVEGDSGDIGEVDVQDTLFFDFEQVEDTDNLTVEIAERFTFEDVVGGEGSALGEALEEQCASEEGCDEPTRDLLNRLLSETDEGELAEEIEGAKPDVTGGTTDGIVDIGDTFLDKTEEHIAALRAGETTGMAAGAAANGASMWLQGYGQTATQDLRDGVAGYDSDTLGGAFGFDSSNIIDGTLLGLAFNYARTNVESKNANTTDTDIDNYGVTLYGSHEFGEQMFLNAQIGYASNKIDSTRHNAGGAGLIANADYDSDQYMGKARLGSDYAAGGSLTLTPSASIAYTRLETDGYTETGTGVLLTVDDESFDSLKLGVDLKAEWDIKTDNGGQAKPSIHAGYDYDTIGDNIEATSSFVGGGSSFTTTGADPARSIGTAGAAFTYTTPANWDITAKYDYTFKADYDSHAGLIRVTSHF